MKKVKIYGGTIDSCLKELRKMADACKEFRYDKSNE